jgi:hypothetical protein
MLSSARRKAGVIGAGSSRRPSSSLGDCSADLSKSTFTGWGESWPTRHSGGQRVRSREPRGSSNARASSAWLTRHRSSNRGVHEKGAFHSASPFRRRNWATSMMPVSASAAAGASSTSWAESARVRSQRLAWVARVNSSESSSSESVRARQICGHHLGQPRSATVSLPFLAVDRNEP